MYSSKKKLIFYAKPREKRKRGEGLGRGRNSSAKAYITYKSPFSKVKKAYITLKKRTSGTVDYGHIQPIAKNYVFA